MHKFAPTLIIFAILSINDYDHDIDFMEMNARLHSDTEIKRTHREKENKNYKFK